MMISTRGRYALRVMIDLAEHKTDGYIPMKEVAARQEISLKYLERITAPIVVVNTKGFYNSLLKLIDDLVAQNAVTTNVYSMFSVVNDVTDEEISAILESVK